LGALLASGPGLRKTAVAQEVLSAVPLYAGRHSLVSTPLDTLYGPGRVSTEAAAVLAPRAAGTASWPARPGGHRAVTMSTGAFFAALSPKERAFLLAPPGVVEGGLSPAAFHAAAVWTTRELGGVATLATLCPGGGYLPPPPGLPGEAMSVDLSHLVRGSPRTAGRWFLCTRSGGSGRLVRTHRRASSLESRR